MRGPNRPNFYEPLKDVHREPTEEEKRRTAQPEQNPQAQPEPEHVNEIDAIEARRMAKQQEVDERVRDGKVEPRDAPYLMDRFDNEELVRMNIEEDRRRGAAEDPQRQDDQSRKDPSQQRAEKDFKAKEHDLTSREEMTEAKQVRVDRRLGETDREAGADMTRGLDDGHERGGRERGE